MTDLVTVFFLVLLAVLAISQVVLVLYFRNNEKAFLADLARALGMPEQEKAHWSMWHDSMKKTQAILGKAELEGVKLVADTRYATTELEKVYEGQLRLAAEKMEQQLAQVVSEAQQEFGKFLTALRTQSDEVAKAKTDEMEKLLDDAMVAFTQRLEQSLTKVEDQVLKLSQEEGMRVKLEVEAYRKTLMAALDSEIADILDEVVKKVVGKGLNLEDQTELVGQALEQAKKEKLINLKPA